MMPQRNTESDIAAALEDPRLSLKVMPPPCPIHPTCRSHFVFSHLSILCASLTEYTFADCAAIDTSHSSSSPQRRGPDSSHPVIPYGLMITPNNMNYNKISTAVLWAYGHIVFVDISILYAPLTDYTFANCAAIDTPHSSSSTQKRGPDLGHRVIRYVLMVTSKNMKSNKNSTSNSWTYQQLSSELLPTIFVMTASKYKEAGGRPICSLESSFTLVASLISSILYYSAFLSLFNR